MAEFEPVVLTARRQAGAGLHLVTLTPPPALAAKYGSPGQYVQVRTDSGSGFFVLAGELLAPSWELLVRNNGDASTDLAEAPEGTVVGVAGPLGKGFALQGTHSRALVVAVAGSALAVARPILRERLAHREAALTSVYIGVRSSREIPLGDEVAGWAHAGARLVFCLSRIADDDAAVLPEALRRDGYVQKVLASDLASGECTGDIVFAAGPGGMLTDLRALASPTLEVVTNV